MNSRFSTAVTRLCVICAIILVLASVASATSITPTTTLVAETGNNTSASSSFNTPSNNGNAAAGNVSKLPIRSLLYSGDQTKVYAGFLGWFGTSNHIQVGYSSDDPAQVHRQVNDMISRGIDGIIVDWFGPNANPVNATTKLIKAQAEAHPGFEFSIMEDVGALSSAAKANGCDVTAQLISDLNYVMSNYANSPAYTRIDGRPLITFFGVGGYYIDFAKVRNSVPGNPLFIFRGAGAFNSSTADGAFQWVDLASRDPFDSELGPQDNFYRTALSTSKVAIGSAYAGFSDGVAAWSGNRFILQRCGQTWLATFAEVAKFYSASNQLHQIQLVTWNDYEEGTEIETGIDNCVDVTANVANGRTLTWNVTGGQENTINHYRLFISTDGQNLAKIADVPTSVHAFDLASLSLPGGKYTAYVKAIGKASIQNKMSPAVVYEPGNTPPVFSLNVTLNGSTNVTAAVTNTGDANGVAGAKIDFGDGTVVNAFSATHTYSAVRSFTITATVFDSHGASSVARKRITPKPPGTGVTVFGPASGATIISPALLTATANSPANITAMRLYMDNNAVYTTDRDFIRAAFKVPVGRHHVVVQAWDATGAVFQSALDVLGEPNDLPPVPRVTVRQAPGGSQLSVLACAVTSSDPDGFISGYAMQFSDGSARTSGPTALHTFAAAGTYSLNLAVVDQFNLGATTSTSFAVPLSGGGGGGATGVTVTSPADGASVTSPVHFLATASSPNAAITAMAVYADFTRVALVTGPTLDKSVALGGGKHNITVQAWDATGAVFKKSMTVNVGTVQAGVMVTSPQNGASVTSPVRFVASASSPNAPITAIAVYADNTRVALVNAATLDQSIAIGGGTHNIVVQAWDATGAVFKTPLNITVGGAALAMIR